MECSTYVDTEPQVLVQQFSRNLLAESTGKPGNDEANQLRLDLFARSERIDKGVEEEFRRINERLTAQRPDDETALGKMRAELLDLMKEFQKYAQRAGSSSTSFPQGWESVRQIVNEVQSEWDTKREARSGRAGDCLRRMCNGLNNHSAALKMIPSESNYTSILSGSIGMILKASANHIEITESFTQGIIDINNAVDFASRNFHDSPVIQQLTMQLYYHVFAYLIKFMRWFTKSKRNRFLGSFNENLHRHFEAELDRVRQSANILEKNIQLYTSADARKTNLMTENINGNLKHLIRLFEESGEKHAKDLQQYLSDTWRQQNEQMAHRQFQLPLGEIKKMLEQTMNSFIEQVPEMMRREISGSAMTMLLEEEASRSSLSQPLPWHRSRSSSRNYDTSSIANDEQCDDTSGAQKGSTIQYQSRHLEDLFDRANIYPFKETQRPLFSSPRSLERLNAFTRATDSRIMYMFEGLYGATSTLRETIGGYVAISRDMGIPVISYFCPTAFEEYDSGTKDRDPLLALVYCLVRQIIHLFPENLRDGAPRLDQTRLEALDGAPASLDSAISLLRDCSDCVGLPMLQVVIHGIEELEERSRYGMEGGVEMLVACLRDLTGSSGSGDNILKVLFTTEGRSYVLFSVLDQREIVECGQSGSLQAPRSRRLGRRFLS